MYELYQNIKRYRLLKGWSQEELARRTGYADKSMISRIESGKVDLSQSQILKFAEIFGVSASELMGNDGAADVHSNVHGTGYYLNEETAEVAQEIYDDPNLRMLFHAARGSKPEDLRMAAEMLTRFKETNPDG